MESPLKSEAIIQKLQSIIENLGEKDTTFVGVIEFVLLNAGVPQHKVVIDIAGKQVTNETKETCDLSITIEDEDFLLVGTHQKSLRALLQEGKITFNGEETLLDRLDDKFAKK